MSIKGDLLRWAKRRATERDLKFNLTEEDLTVPSFCPVLGVKLKRGHPDNAPSLDRIVPEYGYVPGNVIVVSRRANQLKSNGYPYELRLIADFYETYIIENL